MFWFLATAAAATIWSAVGIAAKRLMKDSSGLAYTFLYSSIALVFYTPAFLYFLTTETIVFNPIVVGAFVLSGVANILGFLFYNYSIKLGELSTVIPFTKLNPVFTGILAALFLGETISIYNAAGIVLVTAGSYTILKEKGQKFLDPVRKFKKSDAPKIGAVSALVFSFAAIADRFATQQISPKIYTYLIYLFMTTGLTVYILAQERQLIPEIKQNFLKDKGMYALTGLGAALSSYLIFYSFSQAEASKVIPILQLQVFISVIAGVIIFDEKNIKQKTIGSTILVAGVILSAI
ncbi:MAG: EamA family transporter [Candidatus Nanohaloarchaea archaeon]